MYNFIRVIFGRIFDESTYMKQFSLLLFLGIFFMSPTKAQQLTLKKGIIIDSLQINDSIPESFALFVPRSFKNNGKWPIVFVFDMEGRGKQALRMFQKDAEQQGYLLAASNNINDSLPLSKNILVANRMFGRVFSLFPVHRNRVYTAGFSKGARFASTVPSFIKGIDGVIAIGGGIPNTEILNSKNPFHFIGIVGKEDYNYTQMSLQEKALNKMRFPNQLLVFDGGQEWPKPQYLTEAMEFFTLSAMAKGNTAKDTVFVKESLKRNMDEVNSLIASGQLLDAEDLLGDVISVYRLHIDVDSLKEKKRSLKKEKRYRSLKRSENSVVFNESLIKDDYIFYLEEDILTYNFNNLGWWNYQMQELKKYNKSANKSEQQMGKRLSGFVNALIEDHIDMVSAEAPEDMGALIFLWMLKTLTEPMEYSYYLKIISNTSKVEDFGTALFYLEELLKNGYTDKEELYALEHIALLKIAPEFNKIVTKYLKGSRYDIIEE